MAMAMKISPSTIDASVTWLATGGPEIAGQHGGQHDPVDDHRLGELGQHDRLL